MTTNIALISDVHGNQTALEAVVADIKKQAIDESWFLGDLLMPGPGGSELFHLLQEAKTTLYIRGNWDDCYSEVFTKKPSIDINDPMDIYIGILAKHINKRMTKNNTHQLLKFANKNSIEINKLLLQISHNLPNKNYGSELISIADTENFNQLLDDSQIDIAIYGHIHHQVLRYTNKDQLIINPGSVGMPYFKAKKLAHDRRAQYAILKFNKQGLMDIDFRKIDYDVNAEINLAKQTNLPYLENYINCLKTGDSNAALISQINTDMHYQSELILFLNIEERGSYDY